MRAEIAFRSEREPTFDPKTGAKTRLSRPQIKDRRRAKRRPIWTREYSKLARRTRIGTGWTYLRAQKLPTRKHPAGPTGFTLKHSAIFPARGRWRTGVFRPKVVSPRTAGGNSGPRWLPRGKKRSTATDCRPMHRASCRVGHRIGLHFARFRKPGRRLKYPVDSFIVYPSSIYISQKPAGTERG